MKFWTVSIETREFSTRGLEVRELTGREAVSELFQFDVTLVRRGRADDGPQPGHSATLVFRERGRVIREIHGLIAECVEKLDDTDSLTVFRLRLLPHLHRLSLVRLPRVLVGMTVPQILEKKLKNANIPGALRLAEDYAADSLTVQLKESDLAFLSRLCEHEGIAFHFEHRTSSGELTDHVVFSDTNEALAPADATLTLKQNRRGDRTDVFALERQSKMTSNYFVVADYCDRRPALDLTAEFEVAEEGSGGVVEYGSNHSSIEQGLRLARVRGEEAASTRVEYLGQSDAPAISAAKKLKLDDVDGPSNLELLVIEVTHRFTTRPAPAGSPSSSDDDSPSGGASLEYENSFRAIPFTQTFRPPRTTPKPRIVGLVTGIIEADDDQMRTPWLDENGRYRVRFHFDFGHESPRLPCDVRMAQPSAGREGEAPYGIHFPLRPGTEVVVGFLDGDPDRPIIVGALPNAHGPSPVTSATPTLSRMVSANGVVFEFNDGD